VLVPRLASISLGLPSINSGMVVAVPIQEADSQLGQIISRAIDEALLEANTNGVQGASITPFLLERVRQLTAGRSLEANISLILNNASIGARIAVAMSPSAAKQRSKGDLVVQDSNAFRSGEKQLEALSKL
jgi:pseudouridine-5'-phosphate glycosidase